MLSILTSVLLLFPATPQEPAPSCPSQEAAKVCQEAATSATCDSKASSCDSQAVASCDAKVADMDYALASITVKLDSQEPECSSKSACETKAPCPSTASDYSVVMLKIDDCLEQSGCDSKSECSTATVVSAPQAECSATATIVSAPKAECNATATIVSAPKAECSSTETCETQEPCPSQTKATAQTVRLVSAQQGTCSEVKAQECKPSACETATECAPAECSETQCETNTVVTLVEEIVEEECGDCCEEATPASQKKSACCDEPKGSLVVAKAECGDQQAECSELKVECNEFTNANGEQQIAVVVRVEGEMENLDAQISDLLRQVEKGDHGKGMAMSRVRGAEKNVQWNAKGKDHDKLIQLHKMEGNNVVLDLAGDDCGECGDTGKAMIRKRIEMRAPTASRKVDVRKPMVMKRMKLQEVHEAHGEHGGHAGHGEHGAHGSQNLEQRLGELEARLARIEHMLARLEGRL